MNVVDIRIREKKLVAGPGTKPERWGDERRVLQVELFDARHRTGIGEACPLPGYSRDSLDTAKQALKSVDALGPCETRADIASRTAALFESSPSACFALETAFYDLFAQTRGITFEEAIGGEGVPIPLAALIDSAEGARRAVEEGYETIKIKVGPPLGSAVALLGAVRGAVARTTKIRLDANGSFSVDDARELCSRARAHGVELIEEPVAPRDIERLGELPIPMALDESLADEVLRERLLDARSRVRVHALVLKPSLLGGFDSCFRLARRVKCPTIVSHLAGSGVELRAALALASTLAASAPGVAMAHGLAPHVFVDPAHPIPGLARGRYVPVRR